MESKGRTNVWLLLLGVRIGIILETRVYSLIGRTELSKSFGRGSSPRGPAESDTWCVG